MLRHCGSYADLDRIYDWFAGEWLPAAGLRADEHRPVIIEYYDPRPEIPQQQKRVELCIPLAE